MRRLNSFTADSMRAFTQSGLRWGNRPNAVLSPQRVPFGLARARL